MCPFRNRLTSILVAFVGSLVLGQLCPALANQAQRGGDVASYFPLAVGTYWTYQCSVEGAHQFTKTIRIMSAHTQDGIQYFFTELQMKKDKPFTYYLLSDPQGQVFSAPNAGQPDREPIITALPQSGDHVGNWIVAGHERIDTPALKQIESVLLENFDRDDPQILAERRMEWRGRYFARNIGLVAEADGLGGSCELIRYHIQPR